MECDSLALVTWNGEVVAIFTAPAMGAPMEARDEVRAVPGLGLEGDRYFKGEGAFSQKREPKREVTLIESEAVDALQRDKGWDFEGSDSRRNIVTRDVPLNHLVGREFVVGGVRLRGIKLCEPCAHLEEVSGKSVRTDLLHRGGLNAQILNEGTIRVGDPVSPA